MNKYDIIKKRMRYKKLSKYACRDTDALLLVDEEDDIRPRFFRDSDRIIYSLSYTRYIDKTQVFTFSENDHISKRITHVQFVSKIARTIGRCLSLNEDLIAILYTELHTNKMKSVEKILLNYTNRRLTHQQI